MKNRSIYYYLVQIIKFIDRIIDYIVMVIFIAVLSYGLYGLYDTYNIYNDSNVNDIIKYKPISEKVDENTNQFEDLINMNKDICGWITIEDTNIDYPLLQGKDNSIYLNKDYKGEYSLLGSIFVDSRNNKNLTDNYSLIYGHSMDGNKMFGKLSSYLKKDYFNNHLTGTVYADNELYDVKIFASVYTNSFNEIFYNPQNVDSVQNKLNLISYIKTNARQFDNSISFKESDRIIGMSTCSSETTNGRVIVFAKIEKKKDS